MPIRILPPEVAGKIAAGEVVERPASVVKELVENSIDAGATDIRIELLEGGRRLVRVMDDGCGVPAGEVPLAFARHATSKLGSLADLERIASLGFRGEALASIAAVSEVTILTRPRAQAAGRCLRLRSGEVQDDVSRGCPAGTSIAVEHLFRDVPARLKFMRQAQTEAGHVYTVVAHYALAYPEIRFRLLAEGRQTLQSDGRGHLRDVLIATHGLEVVDALLEIGGAADAVHGIQVQGYTSRPALHRANRNHIAFYVNRRWVQDRSLTHAVIEAYHTLLAGGQYPVALLFLVLDPADVDVNVHPTKREVRFRYGRAAFTAVQRAVRQTLLEQSPVPALGYRPRTWPSPDWQRRTTFGDAGSQQPEKAQLPLAVGQEGGLGDEPRPIGPVRLPLLRVVGQVGQTYLVAEGPQGLYLIDQHAAHERVLYEQMQALLRSSQPAAQALLEPVLLDLDPVLSGTLQEYQHLLQQAGFVLEPFGGGSFLVRSVPAVLATADAASALPDILETLREGDDPLALMAEERLMAAVCKRAAIRAGQVLAPEEMQRLVRQLEQCESPRTCPHGRPTVLHFSVEQLEKEFARR